MRFLFSVIFFQAINLIGQNNTIVKGRVIDQKTNEPITGVGVFFIGTEAGGYSNFSGEFEIKTDQNVDSITFTYVGYKSRNIKIKSGIAQTVNIIMEQDVMIYRSIGTKTKVNKALRIIKNAQNNKEIYNIENLRSFECESFTKVQIAINNVSEKFKSRRMLRSVNRIFDTISSLSEDSMKEVLPIFLSENISRFYFNNNPKLIKEVIIASRVKGVGVEDGSFLSQLLGSTFQQYNFNDNILPILEKNFISPISKNAFNYYEYKLIGSYYEPNSDRKIFQIEVSPKNPLDLVFTGYIWIEDSTFALRKLTLSVTNKANLNFIEKLKITQELERTPQGVLVPVKSRVLIDIAEISKNSAGMIATFSNSYKNLVANKELSSKFFDVPVELNDDATQKSDAFWDTARHEKLSNDEKRALAKIDTLTNVPVIRNYVEFINIVFNGYKRFGKFDIGPYALIYGFNAIEGSRLRIGAKTNFSFSKKNIFSGYTAYGFKDQLWKYKGQYERVLNRKHWTIAGLSYKNDVEQIGVNDDYYGSSNLFTAVSIFAANQLNRSKESKVWLNSEFTKGWNTQVLFFHKEYKFEPIKTFNFAYKTNLTDSTQISSNFTNAGLVFGLRWAPREYYLLNDNERVKQSKPGAFALSLNYTRGIKGVFGSRFDYNRATVTIEKGLSFGYWGRTDFTLSGTKIFEKLPYPLLEVHRGNQSFIYNTSAYNLMNFFEFITDQSLFFKMEHHFNGAIFNRIPLLKKLKWREFVEGRMVMGTLSKKNIDIIPRKDNYALPVSCINNLINKEPYMEVAYGIENIFKVLQVVAVHRLTHLNSHGARKFGIKIGLSVGF